MNTVTFETALALKNAGFPQPQPEMGQFWWFVRYPDGAARKEVLCVYVEKENYWPYVEPLDGGNLEGSGFLFAPQSHDILKQIAFVSGDFIEVEARVKPDGFCFDVFEDLLFGKMNPIQTFNENPHEAAAKAFLELKKAGK